MKNVININYYFSKLSNLSENFQTRLLTHIQMKVLEIAFKNKYYSLFTLKYKIINPITPIGNERKKITKNLTIFQINSRKIGKNQTLSPKIKLTTFSYINIANGYNNADIIIKSVTTTLLASYWPLEYKKNVVKAKANI